MHACSVESLCSDNSSLCIYALSHGAPQLHGKQSNAGDGRKQSNAHNWNLKMRRFTA